MLVSNPRQPARARAEARASAFIAASLMPPPRFAERRAERRREPPPSLRPGVWVLVRQHGALTAERRREPPPSLRPDPAPFRSCRAISRAEARASAFIAAALARFSDERRRWRPSGGASLRLHCGDGRGRKYTKAFGTERRREPPPSLRHGDDTRTAEQGANRAEARASAFIAAGSRRVRLRSRRWSTERRREPPPSLRLEGSSGLR